MAETDRLGAYANWLVANKAKQGTPEFETVANAYRSLRSPAPEVNPNTDGPMEGWGAAFKSGIDGPLENIGDTFNALGATDAGATMKGLTDAPEGYQSAAANFINDPAGKDEGYGWRYAPKAIVEQVGNIGGSVLTRIGGAAVGGAVGSVAPVVGTAGGAVAGAFAGPALFEAVQVLGPVALERAKNDGRDKPNAEDFAWASGTAIVQGGLNAIGAKGGGKIIGALREGSTEALQSVTEQFGSSVATEAGLDIDPRQAVAEGILGAGTMGSISAATSAASKVADVVTPTPRADTPENRANASFAQRIQGIAEANNYNLRDVNTASTTGARETIDKAHVQISEDLKQTFADMRERVKPADLDSLETIQNKVLAQAAYREGRNKTKNTVGVQEMQALEALTGDTFEGAKALNLLREMNVLTTLHNDGYKGGLSQYTDIANPFDGASNTYNSAAQVSSKVLGPLATASAAYTTGGASIPAQIGITAAGRGVDAITGRRSSINRFVKRSQGGAGLEIPAGLPSLRQGRIDAAQLAADQKAASEAASAASLAQRTERLKQTNLGLAKKNAPPVPTSPQGTVEAATGLNRSGVARILRVVEATNQDPLIVEAIEAYRGTVAVGGRVPDISPLIRTINQMVESQPAFKQMRVREPDTGVAQAAATGSPIQTSPENYQRGIDDNKAMLQDLKDGVKTDPTMSPADKSKVLGALDEMGMNLGSDPAGKVNEILSGLDGVDPDAVAAYVEPYAARVMGQQDLAPRSSQTVEGAGVLSGAATPTSSPPKVAEVKQQATLATASLEIGKAGSDLENGIKDMAGIQRLADAYNISIKFYNSNVDMQGAVPSVNGNAMGVYQQRERVAHVVRTGDLNELVTTLHEVLHGVGVSSAKTGNYLGELKTQNGLTGLPDVYGANSLEGLMDFTLGKSKNDPIRRAVLSELKHIQDRGMFTSGGASAPIRGAQSSASALAGIKKHYRDIGNKDFEAERVEIQKELKDHQNYERSIGELTVDALIMYFNDPKTMKRVAPETAKMMRTFLKNAGNKKIQLYSHPLAMVVAAVMAILAKSQAPEEEEQQQMPAGALSPQRGMLTA